MKFNFLVIFDNLVTDDIIRKYYDNVTYEECWKKAMEESEKTGLSFGNFEIFVNCDHPSIIEIIDR